MEMDECRFDRGQHQDHDTGPSFLGQWELITERCPSEANLVGRITISLVGLMQGRKQGPNSESYTHPLTPTCYPNRISSPTRAKNSHSPDACRNFVISSI
jgi:hypothetical protein